MAPAQIGTLLTGDAEPVLIVADRVHTLAPGDPESTHPAADALLVRGNRVVAVGARPRVEELAPGDAALLDLRGSVVTPGFTDAHLHLLEWAVSRGEVDVSEAPSPVAAAEIAARDASSVPGEWVRGRGWNRHRWEDLPHRELLDRRLPDRPVALHSHDMHSLWLNSAALDRLGIDERSPDPPDGRVVRGPGGEPTGVLLEGAVRMATERMPEPADRELADAVARAQGALHRLGITGVHAVEMHGPEFRSLRVLERLRLEGRLRLRVLQHLPRACLDDAARSGLRSGFGGDLLRVGNVKFYLDGTLGSATAWLHPPVPESAAASEPLIPVEEFRAQVERAAAAGLASAVHAIGNAAFDAAYRALAGVRGTGPDLPPRIEHAQLVDLERAAERDATGLVFSVQPSHLITDWEAAEREWGKKRCDGAFPFRFLRDLGGILALGSDAPVERPDPRPGLYAATARRDLEGEPPGGWHPEQRISVAEAVRGYTTGPAAAAGRPNQEGRLLPGFFADLAAWNVDPLAATGRGLLKLRCVATMVGGELVWREEGASGS